MASNTRRIVVSSMANLFTPQFYSFTRSGQSVGAQLNLYNSPLAGTWGRTAGWTVILSWCDSDILLVQSAFILS